MKAIVYTKYGSTNVLQLKEVANPTPKDDEVLIKIHAASVNDWDWGLVRGKPFYIRLFCGLLKPKVNIPGVDIAGQIEDIGEKVKKFHAGDEVYGDLSGCGFGGFAEYVCAPENEVALKPASLSFVEAAAIPHAAMLAVQGLRDVGQIQRRQTLLINGAGGGVGSLGVQIAKSLGVEEVTGVDSASKLDMMSLVGFKDTIDYKQQDFTKNGKRYDIILDTKTNRSIFDYVRALKPKGSYVTVGGTTARLLQIFFLGRLVRLFSKKNFRIVALKPNKELDYLNELLEVGKVKPVIDGPYTLKEVPKVLKYFGEGKHKGKVVISMETDDKS